MCVLVVCGQNKRRSRTAEFLYKNDRHLDVRSVGLSPKSKRKINANDLQWADLVLVMEDSHHKRIREQFHELDLPEIEVLHIPDEYDYLDPELVEILKVSLDGLAG